MNHMRDCAPKLYLIPAHGWLWRCTVALLWMLAFCAFMVLVGWPAIIDAAIKEDDSRYMKQVMIGISQTDRNCLQWRQDGDHAWRCVQR